MRKALEIHYWCLSRGNHKGTFVERYNRFLNKTQVIASNDRGTHSVYIKNVKTSQYALDVNLMPTPTLNTTKNANLFQYLRDVSTESKFALSIV